MSSPVTRLLLVEDDDACADIVIDALAGEGEPVDVERVVRLRDAVARLAAGDIDVVLLDLTLPDAFELQGVRGIRAAAPYVPLVVLAGSVDHSFGARALAEGAHDYLLKDGVDAAALVRTVRSARQRRRYLDGLRAREEGKAREVAHAIGMRVRLPSDPLVLVVNVSCCVCTNRPLHGATRPARDVELHEHSGWQRP